MLLAAALLFSPYYLITLPNTVADPVSDAKGNLYFTFTNTKTNAPSINRLDPNGNIVYQVSPTPPGTNSGGYGPIIPDAAGNLYVAAIAQSITFVQSCALSKIDPNGNVLYSLPVPLTVCQPVSTGIEAVALGADGSVFLAGSVGPGGTGFTTTAGAYVPSSVAAPSQINAYVIKVNPQGTAIVYSTFLNPAPRTQTTWFPSTTALALAVDSQGNAYVAGATDDAGFPTTAGAFMPNCNCGEGRPAIFVAKLNADGSKASYSTFITPEPFEYDAPLDMNPLLPPFLSIAVDSNMQATVMQVQRIFGNGPYQSDTPLGISTTTIAPSGTALSNYFANTFVTAGPISVAPDGQGNLLITGLNAASNLPVSSGAFASGSNFAAIVRAADGAILYATRLPAGATESMISDDNGGFVVTGALIGTYPVQSVQITRFVPATYQTPSVLGVANSAGLQVSGGLAPGELVSIYGVALGPVIGLQGGFDASGSLPNGLGGTEVYFNGVRAPLLYSGNQQVNAIVPFSIQGGASVSVTLIVNDVFSNAAILPERASDAAIFKSNEAGAFPFVPVFAVNQDGTINSSQNPAKPGTIVALFVSGAGLLSPTPVDGQRGGFGPKLVLPVQAMIGVLRDDGSCCQYGNAQIVYAGSAPTLAAGMAQFNLQLPAGSYSGESYVTLSFSPNPVTGAATSAPAAGGIWISRSELRDSARKVFESLPLLEPAWPPRVGHCE